MKKVPLKLAVVLALAAFGRGAQAQDVISIPASTGGLGPNPSSVTIPISITDTAGTPLTETNTAGTHARIRGIGVRILYSPAAAVTSASIAIPAATVGNPCSNATGQNVFPNSGSGFVSTNIQWSNEATGPVFPVGSSAPCLALTLNFAANFPPAGVTLTIDSSNANTFLTSDTGLVIECVAAGNPSCPQGGLTVSAAGTVTPVHLTKFSAE